MHGSPGGRGISVPCDFMIQSMICFVSIPDLHEQLNSLCQEVEVSVMKAEEDGVVMKVTEAEEG